MNIKMHIMAGMLGIGLIATVTASAFAQNAPGPGSPECAITREAIVTLRPPVYGTPSIWDATFGSKVEPVIFSGLLPLPNGNVLAVGEHLDKDYKSVSQIMVELNRRARAMDDKRMPSRPGEVTDGILKSGKGYVISSSVRGGKKENEKWTRLSWYDAERKFVRDLLLKDPVYDFESRGMVAIPGGRGFMAIIHATSRKNPQDQYGMLARLNDGGRLIWKRSYRSGSANEIYGLEPAGDKQFIATGRVRGEDGRMAGWALLLNEDGTLVWQHIYPRGASAVLRAAHIKPASTVATNFIMTGQVMPSGGEPGAAWVMEVDNAGAPVWQRYLRATGYDMDGRFVTTYDNGPVSLMVNAKAVDRTEGQHDHIRLMALSPRGTLIDDQSYVEGVNATGKQMILSTESPWHSERIVVATVEKGGKDDNTDKKVELMTDALVRQEKEKAMKEATNMQGPPAPTPEQAAIIAQSIVEEPFYQGWIFVATALDPYIDPCIAKQSAPAR